MSAIEKEKPDMTDATPTAAKPGPDAVGFDPNKPFRTRDGQEIVNFAPANADPENIWLGQVAGRSIIWRRPDGLSLHVRDLDLVNTSDAPTPRDSVTRPDGGEDDAAFGNWMEEVARASAKALGISNVGTIYGAMEEAVDRDRARRGASAPATEAAWQWRRIAKDSGRPRNPWCGGFGSERATRIAAEAYRMADEEIELQPLYTHPQAAPAATGAVDLAKSLLADCGQWEPACPHAEKLIAALAAMPAGLTPDGGLRLVPAEPTLAMLKAGFDALSKLYPPRQNGGEAIGQFVVWEAMLAAASTPDGCCTSVATSGDTDDAAFIDSVEFRHSQLGIKANRDRVFALARRGIARALTASPRACAGSVTEADAGLELFKTAVLRNTRIYPTDYQAKAILEAARAATTALRRTDDAVDSPAPTYRWIERWFGSAPVKGSWIYEKYPGANCVLFVGSTERDHDLCAKIVRAHNAALDRIATTTSASGQTP